MSGPSEYQYTDHQENAARTEVFVGGLPLGISEGKIRKIFSACGEIAEIRTLKDKKGNIKPFCFVRFVTKESAARAVNEISGAMLDGRKIDVVLSNEQDTLYIGNLNKAWTANDFERFVRQVFPDVETIDLRMFKDTPLGQKHKNRGFAFVKFRSHAAAARAHRAGTQPEFSLGNLHPAVQWAKEDNETDPNEVTKIKIAFVRGLTNDADENYLMRLFAPFGQVEKVVVSKRSSLSPVGFVHFTERLDLERAIEELNEKTVQGPNGGPMCKLQVEIARPMDKSKKRDRENSESTTVHDYSKLSRPSNRNSLFKQEMGSIDPYEEAVIALPLTVKERLVRILRLGIATRFDIDVKSLYTLKELPEANAISVLDQFMLSGAALQNKGAYLDGLISRYLVYKAGSNHNSLESFPHVPNTNRKEPRSSSFSNQVSTPPYFISHPHSDAARPDIYSTHYSASNSDHYPLPSRRMEEKNLLEYPLQSRTPMLRIDERGLPKYPSPSQTLLGQVPGSYDVQIPRIQTGTEEVIVSPYRPNPSQHMLYGRVGLGMEEKYPSLMQPAFLGPSASYGIPGMNAGNENVTGAAAYQESRPQMRFDPFTGEPYKFDPFTGEPIRPMNGEQ